MTHQFHASILREYDVRGIVGDTLSDADAFALGRGYAALATEEGATRVAVGRDGRTHSPEMESALVEGLTRGGLRRRRRGLTPDVACSSAASLTRQRGATLLTTVLSRF